MFKFIMYKIIGRMIIFALSFAFSYSIMNYSTLQLEPDEFDYIVVSLSILSAFLGVVTAWVMYNIIVRQIRIWKITQQINAFDTMLSIYR